ncbi:hypothetical protein [Catalinimonas niigatensis]|uniref:hypothetical protein n=1 Tax=Catalinimonas niigatensis TaxID=1397264 RepID=UPI0026667E4E|nr:hypothetical protein [Catalinimonas niigatensis]WPP51279.1 hypothetical protein PZB72_02600 [Catalinimonas niigatensis]
MHKNEIQAQYWTDVEIRLELMRYLDHASLHFQEKLKQILLDMRLQHESLDSLLKIVFSLLENTDSRSIQIFICNVERVAFDTNLSPKSSEPLISFLNRLQRKKAV